MGKNAIPKIATNSQNKMSAYAKFKEQMPKGIEIKFSDSNGNNKLDPTEWIEYEHQGQRIVGYSPYGNKKSSDTPATIAKRLGVSTDVITKQTGKKINPNTFLRLVLPKSDISKNHTKSNNNSQRLLASARAKAEGTAKNITPAKTSTTEVTPKATQNVTSKTPLSKGQLTNAEKQELVNYLKNEENFVDVAYWDGKHWSIGYGTQAKSSECPKDKDGKIKIGKQSDRGTVKILQDEAVCRMENKLKEIETSFIKGLSGSKREYASLSKEQKIVLLSLGYNVGIEGVKKSKFFKYIKNNELIKAQSKIDWGYNKDNGLLIRHAKEAKRFGHGKLSKATRRKFDIRLSQLKTKVAKIPKSDKKNINKYNYMISELNKVLG